MLKNFKYDRIAAVNYAKEWAFKRNPKYSNFDKMGGDCTNFASQCIFAGCNVMNFTPVTGWYYININNRTPSWTGVQFLFNFLINNKKEGPYAELVDKSKIEIGDIVQFGDIYGNFYHSPVVCGFDGEEVLLAAHTYDAYDRPLSSYNFHNIRYLHILGARKLRN